MHLTAHFSLPSLNYDWKSVVEMLKERNLLQQAYVVHHARNKRIKKKYPALCQYIRLMR